MSVEEGTKSASATAQSLSLLLMASCPAAMAEEVQAAASKQSIFGFTPEGFALAFSPLFVYSVFFVYRATINPKAKVRHGSNVSPVLFCMCDAQKLYLYRTVVYFFAVLLYHNRSLLVLFSPSLYWPSCCAAQ